MQKVADGEGGQASVWTFVDDGTKFALRRHQLRTEEDKRRFAETKEILETLKRRTGPGSLSGAQYIFRLHDVGLSYESEIDAVQIYQWVDGVDLSHRMGKLPALFVADVGAKLSKAVQFIHGLDIIHRDLRPRNIILSHSDWNPVLIDFGFARWLTPERNSFFDNEYSAPEVRRPNPSWTKAADIYSLAATLKAVLRPEDANPRLTDVFQQCLSEDSSLRPEAGMLTDLLEKASRDLHVDHRREEAWEHIQDVSTVDKQNFPWYANLLRKFQSNFEAVALGCTPEQFDRCREVADFLNQVLEASSQMKPQRLKLGFVKDSNAETGSRLATREIRFLHAIRNYQNHGDFKKERAIREFNDPTDEEMQAMALAGCRQIAEFLSLDSLPRIVEQLL
jgi:serine/threonine protein kinase